MGRLLLLLIAAAGLAGGVLSRSALGSDTASAARRADSESGTVAREAAESGLAITMGQVLRSFQARPLVQNVTLSGPGAGVYDAFVRATGRGPLDVGVTGRLAGAQHQIAVEAIPLTTIGAPLVVSAETVTFAPNGSLFEIRGADHRQPGALVPLAPLTVGAGRTATAIRVTSSALAASFTTPITAAMRPRVSGVQSEADVSVGGLPPIVPAMFEQALTSGTIFTGNTNFSNRTLGAPGAPVVYVVQGNSELSGTTMGYGLLVVQGDFKMKDTARWEGVVIVQADSDERLSVDLERNSTLVGSLALLGKEARTEEGDVGLPGGHFDVDVFTRSSSGMRRAYHKHQYDDSYNLTHVDLLAGPGVSTHWNTLQSTYAGRPLRMELFNTINGSGTLDLASPAGTYSVRNCNPFTTVIVPNLVTTFRTNFTSLQGLRGTSPGHVSGDATNRNRAYSIRLYDGTTLVYEVSAYEHTRPRDGSGGCNSGATGGGGSTGPEYGDYGRFDVSIKESATLRYSEEAIAQVGFALSTVRDSWRIGREVRSSVPLN